MINGFWNGLSGINVHENALDAESNNISNINTTAHKSDRISFADMMYRNSGFGNGAATQIVEKNFTQGEIKNTGHSFDVAIEGKGFFIVKDIKTSDVFYTRAGNFKMDNTGLLVTAEGMKVQGVPTAAPTIVSSDPAVTSFNKDYVTNVASKTIVTDTYARTINARATDFVQSAKASGVHGQGYKDASSKVSDIQALITNYKEKLDLYGNNPNAASTPGQALVTEVTYTNFLSFLNDPNDVIRLNIDGNEIKQNFDTDIQTTMNAFADKVSKIKGLTASVDTNGVLRISSLIPGKDVQITDAAINNHAPEIKPITAPSSGSGLAMIQSARAALKTALENADAKLLDLTNNVTLPNGTGIVAQDLQLKPNTLNLSDANFGKLTIEDGKIFVADGDNKYVVGALSTAAFNDEQSLNPEGGNLFSTSIGGSTPIDASKFNTIVGTSLELSNSKFAENLSNMMVYQRAFGANSKSLTTSDELLKTAIQLKK